jgi:hypothetical protein
MSRFRLVQADTVLGYYSYDYYYTWEELVHKTTFVVVTDHSLGYQTGDEVVGLIRR